MTPPRILGRAQGVAATASGNPARRKVPFDPTFLGFPVFVGDRVRQLQRITTKPADDTSHTTMELWRNYYMPKTVDEALAALAEAPRPVTLIAGGIDLLLDLEAGRHDPEDQDWLALELAGRM